MGRKRLNSVYSEDSDQDDCINWRRQYEPADSHKRSRRDVTRGDRLELLIYKLAERDTGAIESDIERLSEVLLAEVGGEYQDKINELLHICIYAVPEKMTIYSSLVGVMNARNSAFGAAFLQSLWTHLHRCLSGGQFTHVQRSVRFICDLLNSRVINSESLLNLLGTLINTACSENENSNERRSDFFV